MGDGRFVFLPGLPVIRILDLRRALLFSSLEKRRLGVLRLEMGQAAPTTRSKHTGTPNLGDQMMEGGGRWLCWQQHSQ